MQKSYWQTEGERTQSWQSKPVSEAADFAVVGGGLAGLSTALCLRKRHPTAQITLLEAKKMGHGASGRNAGFLSPLAAPLWLLSAHAREDWRWAAAHLNHRMHEVASRIAADFPDAELEPSGLSLEATGRLSESGLWEFSDAINRCGLDHTMSPSTVHKGQHTLLMDGHQLHPFLLVTALAQALDARGVALHEGVAVRAIENAPHGADLVLEQGRISAKEVVLCTNGYTGNLDVGERLPGRAISSFMLATGPLSDNAATVLQRDGDFTVELVRGDFYHRTHRGRFLFGGLDEVVPGEGDVVSDKVKRRLTKAMQQRFAGGPEVRPEHIWGGKLHDSMTELPIIRRSKAIDALTLNVGYAGTGVALTQVCAPMVAAIASRESVDDDDDDRLLRVIQDTSLPVRDGLRAIGKIVMRLPRPAGRSSFGPR